MAPRELILREALLGEMVLRETVRMPRVSFPAFSPGGMTNLYHTATGENLRTLPPLRGQTLELRPPENNHGEFAAHGTRYSLLWCRDVDDRVHHGHGGVEAQRATIERD